MRYGIPSAALLLTLLFSPHSVMAENVKSDGEGEVIYLNKSCQECLLNCAQSALHGRMTMKDCVTVVCRDQCKTREEK